MPHGLSSCRLGPPLIAALLFAGPVHAQIVTDGSVGPKVSLSGSSVDIGANLGTRLGDNLFHSFEKFGIATGQTATFTGPDTVKNVISRVTGGEISNIDGTLASRVGQADLYFLNPAGVIFGPNAQLDVPGSFHVSTAHELRFDNGVSFSALDKASSGLTVAPPEAFGFLDRPDQPGGRITVDRSHLKLEPGKTFSLVGGDIAITGKRVDVQNRPESVSAREGTVNLASITGSGRVRPSDGAVEATRQGTIQLANGAVIAADGNGGGSLRIRGGILMLQDSSAQAKNTGDRNSAGIIDVQADEVRLANGDIATDTSSVGSGGSITLQAKDLMLSRGSNIKSDAVNNARGAGGKITVRATDISILEGSKIGNNGMSSVRPGTVIVLADNNITLANRSSINSDARTNSIANPADVTVRATGTLRIHDISNIRSETNTNTAISSEGSILNVTAGAIELRTGSTIRTNTFQRGNAGNVIVHADYISIDGTGSGRTTGIAGDAGDADRTGRGIGNAGHVTIDANKIELTNGGVIQTETWGENGGTIDVQVDHLVISGLGNTGILSRARRDSRTGNAAIGNAGSITVRAGQVELRDGGGIRTDTQSTGNGGTINVVADSLQIFGRADTGQPMITIDSGITSNASAGSTGNAGAVTVTARELVVRGGGPRSVAGISSATATARDRDAPSIGNAGTVTVSGDSILLTSGGIISTESAGSGAGGPITLTARNTLRLDGGAEIRARTTMEQGGDVTLAVGRLFNLRNSRVTTSVATGGGNGGNIQIKSPLMVLDNSDITADAQGGSGGNIFIDVGQLIRTPDSKITASGSVNGNITIAAPDTDISSSLVVLPETLFDASSQLRVACAARGGRRASSLTPGGRGGLPPDPGTPLMATPSGQSLKQQTATGSPTALTARPQQAVKPITVSGIPQPVLGSPRLTCRG
jgi:filamentous hemagglutinin family protein